jgi:metallophosphoesterase (TIGR00282 family)
MRILFLGDIVGKPGRQICTQVMRGLRAEENLDLVVANAENVAGGSGLTPEIYHELLACGIDGITMGDHVYRRREIFSILQSDRRIVRPANFPASAPGHDFAILRTRQQVNVAIFVLLGRVFMPPVDCPFHAADRVLAALPADIRVILVDFHAEATSDKQLMGRHLDGRVSAVLGTHTHVATADEQILPGGTAFQCDVGMTGPHESILGRRIDRVMETTRTFRPTHFEVATGDVRLNGAIVEVDPQTGRATAIRRIRIDQATAKRLEGGRGTGEGGEGQAEAEPNAR